MSAAIVPPIATVRMMMITFMNGPAAVFARRSVTPHSFMRLPSINIVMRGATGGKNRLTMIAITTGKAIFSTLLTLRNWAMPI